MIYREHYIAPVRDFYDSDLIKIITGIRRCGKSVILDEILSEIKTKTDNIIDLDFEDASVLLALPDASSLIKYIEEHRKPGKCYVFLDEVQRVEDWAVACRTIRLHDCSVFISGSNSKLLSKEFTKELSGRYVAFRVRPFVYKELCEYAKELGKEVSVTDYLVWGGFPKRLEFNGTDAQKIYLNDLNETIIINDIINRYGIRKTDIFRKIANYVLISNARVFSARSVHDYLKSNGFPCSVTTITKYLGYLEEAFAIETVKLYSGKAKRELNYYQKTYDEDVSSIRFVV
ncbi:MAG: ATP-binding protein [Ruminococcus sp.]|nr:ATP-binding protein [Candidatus Copronaster equi]